MNLEIPTNNVNEDEGPAIVCAVVVGPNTTCPFQNNFAVSISTNATLEGTVMCRYTCPVTNPLIVSLCTESLDFRPLSSVVFFAPCEKRNCTEVNIIDDMQVELVESFAVTMQRTPGLTSAITFEQDGGRISITDDDGRILSGFWQYCFPICMTMYKLCPNVGRVFVLCCIGSGKNYKHSFARK